jgi:protein KRI1
MPPLLSSSDSEDDVPIPPKGFAINEAYAKRLEHNKAREELHRLQAKYPGIKTHAEAAEDEDEEDDSSTSESEDEVGELVTPHVDAQIWRTLAMLREGAPEVYDENWTGFDEDEEEGEHVTKEKKEKVSSDERRL